MKATYTVTLSRAHKIADRLGSAIGELKSQAERLTEMVVLQGYAESQIEKLNQNAEKALALLALHRLLALGQADVRSAIGRVNASAGVGDVLARIEANKKMLAALEPIVASQATSSRGATVHCLNVKDYKPLANGDSVFSRGGVNVTILSEDQINKLDADKKSLERENFGLSDKLAELNGKTVTFELLHSVAELAGLKEAA